MTRFLLTFSLAACLAAGAGYYSPGVKADDKKTTDPKPVEKSAKPTEVTPEAKALKNLQMGFQLAEYARKNKLPEAMITAAQIIGTTPMKEHGDEKLPDGLKPYDPLKEASDLLDEAVKMEAATDATKKLAADTKKSVAEFKRGAIGGPKFYEGVVGPGATRTYQVNFAIGQLATIHVRNTTHADLDLYVMCNRSGWTTHDRHPDDDCHCAFTVGTISTSGFTLRVVNYSTDKAGRYVLFTN